MGFVRVVNMIPGDQSDNTFQNSEPNLAVNPERPSDMVATAFDPGKAIGVSPIYISTDGGLTWGIRSVVPGRGSFGTGDITVSFATTGGILYAGILNGDSTARLQILRTGTLTNTVPMTVLVDRTPVDQPWVAAGTTAVSGRTVDRVYVGNRDERPGQTSAVDVSMVLRR